MSVLRNIESKLESLFEGVFGRAFRTNVQPVELARKLVKEMDDHRSVSVSRVYVPNEYTIYLSPGDREQFASYEQQLRDELSDYLTEHARRERYVLLTPPRVQLETDDDLDVGVFGIATRLVQTGARSGEAAVEPAPGATMIYKPSAPVLQPTEAASAVEPASSARSPSSRWDGQRHEVAKQRVVLGRSKDCRHPGRRPERLAPARRAASGGRRVLARRPRLDERHRGGRQAGEGARSSTTAPVHDRLDRDRRSRGSCSSGACLGPGRDDAPCPQDRLPRPALPLHLADRPLRRPRPAPAPGVDDPRAAAAAAAGLLAQPSRASSAGSSCCQSPALGRGRRLHARLDRADRRPRAATTTSSLPGTSSLDPPRALRAAPRRRLDRGRRLDERHLRERDPADARSAGWSPATSSGSARPT